jgi:hypothetical protein
VVAKIVSDFEINDHAGDGVDCKTLRKRLTIYAYTMTALPLRYAAKYEHGWSSKPKRKPAFEALGTTLPFDPQMLCDHHRRQRLDPFQYIE